MQLKLSAACSRRRSTDAKDSANAHGSPPLRLGVHDAADGRHVIVPVRRLIAESSTSGGGEPIELRAFSLLRHSPLGVDPAALLHAVEGRIECAIENGERR